MPAFPEFIKIQLISPTPKGHENSTLIYPKSHSLIFVFCNGSRANFHRGDTGLFCGSPITSNDSSFFSNFLVLPTGQILFTDFFFVSAFNPSGTYNPAWAPTIQTAPARVKPGGSYTISGHRFNGFSQGAAYGDDQQSATNYPLVRITNNRTGHVFYSRTHDHSSMAVASADLVNTHFDVPASQEHGASQLVVVVNGIPSAPVAIMVD
jgi:hypothetical protein